MTIKKVKLEQAKQFFDYIGFKDISEDQYTVNNTVLANPVVNRMLQHFESINKETRGTKETKITFSPVL